MLYHNIKFDMILRGIVMTRGESGATIAEMRHDYYYIFNEPWPLKGMDTNQIITYLTQIDGLMMERHDDGLCIWYIDDIGSSISERDLDSNNNIITSGIEDSSVNVASLSSNNNSAQTQSYLRIPQIMITSPYGDQHRVSQNGINKSVPKRNLSFNSSTVGNSPKRCLKSNQANLPLIEKNLDIHNRNSGGNSLIIHTNHTSTEKEVSILLNGDTNGCIEVNDSVDYVGPIHKPVTKQLSLAFAKRCKINDSSNSMPTESTDSTVSLGEELFSPRIGLVGDDFMRSFLSFELYGADFTSDDEKQFGFCNSGQKVRDAFHLIYDKQNYIQSKYQYVIINVGAIDILTNKDLVQIQVDYARLVNAIDNIRCKPIIATIPDIRLSPNHPNQKTIRQTLLLLNRFLTLTYGDKYPIIDLHAALPKFNANGTNRDCYYFSQPKRIHLGNEKLDLYHWSQIGREQIFKAIEECVQNCPSDEKLKSTVYA